MAPPPKRATARIGSYKDPPESDNEDSQASDNDYYETSGIDMCNDNNDNEETSDPGEDDDDTGDQSPDESDEEQSTSSRSSRALVKGKRKFSPLDDNQPTKRAKTSRKGKPKAVENSAPPNPRSFGDEGNNFNFQNSLSYDLPPLITTRAIFEALTKRIFRTSKANLQNFCQIFAQTPLKVLTFCSGTESPILGLQMVQKTLRAEYGEHFKFLFEHEGSAEIHPAKAAYIQRNFPSKAILRDIIELVLDEDPEHPRTMTTMYGSKVEVPSAIDILIAGFACDDFSTLNNVRKTLTEKGESGDTFFAVLAYMVKYTPLMVILENVIGAPWVPKYDKKTGDRIYPKKLKSHKQNKSIQEYVDEAGYFSIFFRVDTKDFAIPQTRIRGYMVCVLKSAISEGMDWKLLKKDCENLVEALKRSASAPVEAMLFPPDHPALKSIHGEIKSDKKPVDWDKCSMGHGDYSRELGLGNKHPITNWKTDGSRILPDFHIPMACMTERVADTVDIAHKRSLQRGFDDTKYNRQLELSQNVYRVRDTIRNGVQQCLTPSNIAYSTYQGRRLTGAESARLQGIDTDQINTSNMSESLLQDMCGNAMTSPVVTTITFAALLTFHSVFTGKVRVISKVESEPEPSLEGRDLLVIQRSNPCRYTPVSVEQLTALAQCTVRLCLCEGRFETIQRQFQRCRMCWHSTCVKCGKQPVHEYEPLKQSFLDSRQTPITFEDAIKESVPMVVDLRALHSTQAENYLKMLKIEGTSRGLDVMIMNRTLKAIDKALLSFVRYQSIRRTNVWTITWISPEAILKLVITGKKVEWLLYANVSDEPLGSEMGGYLRQYPIACMTPDGDDIIMGEWAYWLPIEQVFKATVTSSGPLIPTYKNNCGLAIAMNEYNHSIVEIRIDDGFYDSQWTRNMDIRGSYIALPVCGQAFSTFHCLQDQKPSDQPLGLFFHHTMQSGDPATHSFIVSSDLERKDWGEYPEVAARFTASWRQPIIYGVDSADGSHVFVRDTDTTIHEYVGSVTDEVEITAPGRFVDIGIHFLALSGPSLTYRHLPVNVAHLQLSCSNDFSAFECSGTIGSQPSSLWRKNAWNVIGPGDRFEFWQALLWANIQQLKINGHREANTVWHTWSDDLPACATCAPPPPEFLWTLNKKGKHVPYEHPEQAADWESAMKARPSPMSVMFRIDNFGNIDLRVFMNAATLIHRAKAKLLTNGGTSDVHLSWRLVTDDGRDLRAKFDRLTLRNNDSVQEAKQPFATYQLRPEQLRVVTWMMEQEASGTIFIEEEVVEALIQDIGYRAEGRATRQILRHGGILAQDVGFGKTVVVLASIKNRPSCSAEKLEAVQNLPGKIYTEANLIIMPPHLVKQWKSEIEKFVPEFLKRVIVIEQPKDFSKLTIEKVQRAKIVLVSWGTTTKAAYIKRLATLAGIVEPVENPSVRECSAWYKNAISSLEDSVNFLRTDPQSFIPYVENKWVDSVKEAESVDVRVPSKHLTGASYVNSDKRQSKGGNTNPKAKKASPKANVSGFDHSVEFAETDKWQSMMNVILELFHWRCITLDEHTYGNGTVGIVLSNLVADFYWMLSGTPALGGHGDVKILANLLHVYLGVDDFTALKSDIFKQKTHDLTKSELFLIHQESPSVKWRERRQQLAQIFLNKFCRKDVVDVEHIKMTTHYHLVDLSPSERAIYLELVQFLAATDFVIVRTNDKAGDRNKQIHDVVHGSGDGKPALFMRASHFTFGGYLGKENPAKLLQHIIRARDNEYKESVAKFKKLLRKTYWLHRQVELELEEGQAPCKQYVGVSERIQGHDFGDLDTTKALSKLIREAPIAYRDDDWRFDYRPSGSKVKEGVSSLPEYPTGNNTTHGVTHVTRMQFELRTAATELNKATVQLVKQARSLRFVKTIAKIQANKAQVCSHCSRGELQVADVKLMAQCGHLLAKTCSIQNDCPVNGCNAYNRDYQKMIGSSFGETAGDFCSAHGSKLDAVLRTCKRIKSLKEFGLIFVQYEQSTAALEKALTDKKIAYADLRKESTASNVLENFQNRKAKKGEEQATVLILNIGDANASGSNLTVANHILFLQPYYTSGENAQDKYDSAMTQAVGRARRNGQTKEVHVYHFLTVDTIDIDYHEARTDQIIERDPKNPSKGVAKPLKGSVEWKTELGTWFAKTMKFDDAMRKDN